jgi:hypothetical protein
VAFVRTWTIDQFEFPDPADEEHLEIALSARSDFPIPNVTEFVACAVGVKESEQLAAASPLKREGAAEPARAHLANFAGIELPKPCDWPTYDLSQGPGEIHLIIEGPECFIRYHWSTSA